MAITFRERPRSQASTANPPSVTYEFVAYGSTDYAAIQVYALGATPAFVSSPYGTLYRQDIRVDPEASDHWAVTVPYGKEKKENGSFRLSFDTTGGTTHILVSKATVARFPADAANHMQLIGVKGEEECEGADIIIPALKLTASFKHPEGIITLAKIKTLARFTGYTNSSSFLTFDAGEVLFLGATGSEGTDSETEVNYQFAMSQNASGLTIGEIANIAKKGHELAWVSWEKHVDAGKAARKPLGVYIERVYDDTDLASLLGFG